MSQGRPERPVSDLHLWEIRSIRDILSVLVVAVLFWLGYIMRDVTIPLLVAMLLAYLFEPLIVWMTKTRWIPFGRVGAVSWLLTGTTLILLVALAVLLPRVVNQAADLIHDVRSGVVRTRLMQAVETHVPEEYQSMAMELVTTLPAGFTEGPGQIDDASVSPTRQTEASDGTSTTSTSRLAKATDIAQSANEQARQSGVDLVGIASRTGSMAWAVIVEVIAVGMLLFLIPFYFFFFSLWYPQVCKFANSLIPESQSGTIIPLLHRMDEAVAGFVRGRIVIAIIMAVLYAVGWAFMGVPYAILLAIVVGAFSLVPFLGLVGIPVAIVMLAVAQFDLPEAHRMTWWGILLWPTLVFAVVNTLDGWVLTPLIAGKATNLDPVTIFVAVLAGGSVMGAYGMLLAIPIAACIKILLSDLVIPKLRELAGRMPTTSSD
ncbi:MAG: AI-2E family transporter [Phycisphaerales bacterium]|nr:AI-2E family transporter [Phycisphaerales bacterium]